MTYLVYGYATIRFCGLGSTSSPASRSIGNHAYGLVAATFVIGANSAPMAARFSSGERPRWARRATSRNANVVYAWNTSCATSAGWNGASNGNGRFFAG